MESLERAVTEPAAGLGEGLLLGVKRALGEDLEEAFRRAGIIHIVVLSGYNVMIVAEAIMRLLSFFFLPRTRMLIGVAGIVTFALLVGLSATVVRASIMAILVLIARATGRIYAIVRALMLAGAIMLIINPYLLAFDPGFQLSFLATLGLIFLAPLFERRFGLFPTTLQIREFVTATIATQIFVLPLLLYLIGEFSVVAVIVNVLVLPMVPVAMFLTFVTGVAGTFIAPLATVLGFAAYLSLEYIIALAEFFAALPLATFRVPAFPFSVVVLAYAGITYLIYIAVTQSKEPEMEMDDTVDDLADWTIVEEKDNGTVVTRDTLPFR
jgi:competence protein ComEC